MAKFDYCCPICGGENLSDLYSDDEYESKYQCDDCDTRFMVDMYGDVDDVAKGRGPGKKAYYLDFTVMLYTTRVIEASSESEARRIAEALSNSHEYWHDRMAYDFSRSEILPENSYVSEEDPGYYVNWKDTIDETDDERYMGPEEIARYVKEA